MVINVDRGAGPAWRLQIRDDRLTLMPSVWRTSGCRSHFVLWNSTVWWCGTDPQDGDPPEDERWPAELVRELRAEWKRIRSGRGWHG